MAAERLRDLTDVVDLQRVHGDLLGAVIDQVELSAFVQGASQLSFPLGRIRFIKSLLELPRLHSPGLEGTQRHSQDTGPFRVTVTALSSHPALRKTKLRQ